MQKPSILMVDDGTIDPQTGFGPIVWDSWETNWTGIDLKQPEQELFKMVLIKFTVKVLVVDLGSCVQQDKFVDSVTEERIQNKNNDVGTQISKWC